MVKIARLVVVAVGALLVAWWWRLRTEAARVAVSATRASSPRSPGWGVPAHAGDDPRPAAPPWVAPADDGSCPAGHPVKAKEGSGIFHPPDGRLYARTQADRCYVDDEAAAADGFRRSQV